MQSYLFGIVAGAVLTAVVMSLPLRASLRKIAQLACGCLLVIVTLAPLVRADLRESLREQPIFTEQLPGVTVSDNDELLQQLIKEQTEALINEKAKEFSITAAAEVELRYDSEIGSYVPYRVKMKVSESKGTLEPMREYLSAQLGIPEERQQWILN